MTWSWSPTRRYSLASAADKQAAIDTIAVDY
jgi:hypothetical protein